MFKQILVAFKFSEASRFALKKAIQIAKVHQSELHIFHALDFRLKELEANDPKLIKSESEIKQRFETEAKPLLADFEPYKFSLLPADPAMGACRIANQMPADLIVLGCHQIQDKECIGRVDYVGITIMEKAPCPVMLVPYCP